VGAAQFLAKSCRIIPVEFADEIEIESSWIRRDVGSDADEQIDPILPANHKTLVWERVG
jgi:hypothetical protein